MNRVFQGPRHRTAVCWNLLWILIFIAGLAFLFIGMPKTGDDIQFALRLKPWFDAQGLTGPEDGGDVWRYGMPWAAIRDTWAERFATNNIRLGGVLAPVLLAFPKWVGGSLMLLCASAIIFMTLRLADVDWRRSALVPVYLFCFAVLIVCGDYLGELDFQLNYLPPTALYAMLLLWLREHSRFTLSRMSAAFVTAFVAGAWHEGLDVPVGAGLLFTMLRFRSFRRPEVWAITAGIVCGFILLCLSPGMRNRVNGGGTDGYIDPVHMRFAVTSMILWLISSWIVVSVAARLGLRKLCDDPLSVFCVVSALLSFSVMQKSGVCLRGGWWGFYVMGLFAVRMPRMCDAGFWSVLTRRNILIWAPLLTLVYVHQGFVGYWSLRFRSGLRAQAEVWAVAPCSQSFWDMPVYGELPWICFGQPVGEPDNLLFSSVSYWYGGRDDSGRVWAPRGYTCFREPVPLALSGVTAASGEAVPGSACVRRLGRYLFVAESGDLETDLRRRDRSVTVRSAKVDVGKGSSPMRMVQVSFVSECDGERYSWLIPVRRGCGNPVDDVRLVDGPLEYIEDK